MGVNLSSGQSIKWDLGKVPCRHEERGSKCAGILLMAFAAFWGGLPTFIIILFIIKGEFVPIMLMLLIFTVIGTVLFLSGLDQFFTHTVTEFDGRIFRYRHKSLFSKRAWDERLSKYEGVLARSEYHPGRKNRSSYTLYIVELLHPDKQRRIKLWESCNSSGHRANWETYSRQLALPALWQDKGNEEYTQRAPEDLDKSVRELAAEGKLEISFDSTAAVPEKVELNVQGEQLEVVITAHKIPLIMLPMILIPPCIFYLDRLLQSVS